MASGKVVGSDKVPEFPKQAQEFLGTVCPYVF